jgi:uncharacterized protein (DUF983 family)
MRVTSVKQHTKTDNYQENIFPCAARAFRTFARGKGRNAMRETAMRTQPKPLIKALMTGRCPVCREGAMFTGPWYRLDFLKVHQNCPVCNADFIPEPGFYTGAMYVNYAFNITQLLVVGLFTWLVFQPDSPWVIIAAVLGVTFLTIPFTARASRVIWLYLFGNHRFEPSRMRH